VFVVASARDDFDPAAVLFEFDGLRRDSAPSREAGQAVAGTFKACASSGGWSNSADHAAAGYMQPVGCEFGPGGGRFTDLNPTLDTRAKDGPIRNQLAGAVMTMAHGQGGMEIATDRAPTPICNHEAPIAAYAIQAGALRTNPDSGPDGVGIQTDHAYTLEARAEVQCVAHSLRGEGFDASEDGTGRGTPLVPVAVSLRGREGGATAELGDEVQNCLRASQGGGDKPHVLAPVFLHANKGRPAGRQSAHEEMVSLKPLVETLTTDGHAQSAVFTPTMAVRRLTPVECERLQGFPDNYTAIPWRKKPASECPDGPRYKALGNSWAVPVVRWIGHRIQADIMRSTNPTTITFSTPTP
jgi:DNA (cytosine-5)-methyltransferase 1